MMRPLGGVGLRRTLAALCLVLAAASAAQASDDDAERIEGLLEPWPLDILKDLPLDGLDPSEAETVLEQATGAVRHAKDAAEAAPHEGPGPVAAFSCTTPFRGPLVAFQDESHHSNGTIVWWKWELGEDRTVHALTPQAHPREHIYSKPGYYVVALTVVDLHGHSDRVEQVCAAPPSIATAPSIDTTFVIPTPPPQVPCISSKEDLLHLPVPVLPCPGTFEAAQGTDSSAPFGPMPPPQPPSAGAPAGTDDDASQTAGAALPREQPGAPVAAPALAGNLPDSVLPSSGPIQAALGGALILALPVALLAPGLRDAWRVLPLWGLFTRIREDKLLEHPLRQQIIDLAHAEPGIHFQAILRAVEKGNGVVEHHLRLLCQGGHLKAMTAGGYTCYFPARGIDRRVMGARAVLKSDVARRVLGAIMVRPGESVGDVARHVGVTSKAVSYHLGRFESAGLVRLERSGRTVRAYTNPLATDAMPFTLAADAAA